MYDGMGWDGGGDGDEDAVVDIAALAAADHGAPPADVAAWLRGQDAARRRVQDRWWADAGLAVDEDGNLVPAALLAGDLPSPDPGPDPDAGASPCTDTPSAINTAPAGTSTAAPAATVSPTTTPLAGPAARGRRPVIPAIGDGPVDGPAIGLLDALPLTQVPVTERIDAVDAWRRAVDFAYAGLYAALAAGAYTPEPDGVAPLPGRSGGGQDWTLEEVKAALASSEAGARDLLDAAAMLAGPLSSTWAMLRAGRIRHEAVTTLIWATRHLRDDPDALAKIEAELIDRVNGAIGRGQVLTLTQLRALIHRLVAKHEDPARAGERARRAAHTERRVCAYPTENGMGAVHANLTAPETAFCEHALTRLARKAKHRGDHSSLANRRANALINALAHATNGTPLFPNPIAPHECTSTRSSHSPQTPGHQPTTGPTGPTGNGPMTDTADGGPVNDTADTTPGAAPSTGANTAENAGNTENSGANLAESAGGPVTGWTWEDPPPELADILWRPPGRPLPTTPPEPPPWGPAQEPPPDDRHLSPRDFPDTPDTPDPYPDDDDDTGDGTGDHDDADSEDPESGCPGCGHDHQPKLPVEIQLIIDLPTLLALKNNPAHLPGYGPLPAELARELADGGALRRLVTDPATGALLDYGHHTYIPPKALREFVKARDQRCLGQGCNRRAQHCDLDHLTPHPQGRTAATNLGPECRHTHRLKTISGWTIKRDHDGTITWTTPGGRRYTIPPFNHHEDY
jgi:hypothetical protein